MGEEIIREVITLILIGAAVLAIGVAGVNFFEEYSWKRYMKKRGKK